METEQQPVDYQAMKIHLLHIGKSIPKRLLSHGWRETGHSIHHGPTDGDKLGVPESVDKMIKTAFSLIPI